MAGLPVYRAAGVPHPMEFLDFTSVTLDEFQQLVPPFEAAFHARMAAWRMDGEPQSRAAVHRLPDLPPADPGRSAVLHSGLPQNLCPPGGPGAPVWYGAGESQIVDPTSSCPHCWPPFAFWRCPEPLSSGRPGAAAQYLGGCRGDRGCPAGGGYDFARQWRFLSSAASNTPLCP